MNRDKLHKIIRWIIVLTILLICFASIIETLSIYIYFFHSGDSVVGSTYAFLPTPEAISSRFTLIICIISPFYAANRFLGFVRVLPDGKTFSERLWKWIGYHGVPSLSFNIFSIVSLLIILSSLVSILYIVTCLIFLLGIPAFVLLQFIAIPVYCIAYTAFVILKKLCVEIFRLIKPAKGVINEPAVSK